MILANKSRKEITMTREEIMKGLATRDTSRTGKLNLENAIQEGRERVRNHTRHSLMATQMEEIADKNENRLFDSMGDAFFLGVRQGYRIAQKERKNHDK